MQSSHIIDSQTTRSQYECGVRTGCERALETHGSYSCTGTRSFVSHHATAISLAITTGAATAIVDGVSKLETRMAAGG